MGSGFAAVKAGILGGIFYAGGIGLFNAALLYAFKGEVLQVLSTLTECAGTSATSQLATPEDCFSTLVSVNLPFFVFIIFIISLFFAAAFGLLFEHLPGRGYRTKATSIGLLMLILVLYLGAGIVTDATQRYFIVGFELFGAIVYSLVLARFYRRYTREVEFQTPDSSAKIMIDDRNYTGRLRTFAAYSSHRIRAVSDEKTFKEWLVSGGVSVEDPKSFETTMKIEGDGLLKAAFK